MGHVFTIPQDVLDFEFKLQFDTASMFFLTHLHGEAEVFC